MTTKKSILAALALGASVTLLAGCAGGAGGNDETVKIGVVGASDPYWADYTEAAAEEGITVEVVDFADYNQPNPALTNGDIDMNQFQHLVYLADYNVSSGEDLTPIGATAIYPLGLYSTKVTDVADLGKGDTVAVPNDASNLARALLVLQSADLLTLKDGGTIFSTLDDVDTEKSLVTVTALEPSLTATSLPDVDAAIINNDFVEKAGLKFEDALVKDDPSDESALPYVNVFAVRADDKDNETYAKLVELFQTTTTVTDGLLEVSGNSAVLATTSPADLQAALATVEKDTAAQK
ncbi:methionine ABC transporter substrate-binding protein [Cryobacterium zongtaii]|uniref:Methionine ABC transporter substrate-binding protein n=1 Tax=Cryobacterium zongtaii TaxID=1259217 RepID=A0A2S3ZQD0_9MICO|nr:MULTISPECIES: MetQ/NlpA family ABC transporter substrate-binding protein [Cryobacterium]ASD24060.1 methionine ABC transporter substrate-binding protein [Cryobacterium sp. LW097]POH71436.1 methionine ABC transporter substrate-binding protein [Cryobacterium zongtaii]TFC51151.1 methionine ABC transporter substrate-binding protein [Cryobacterium sp. TMB3-1-2]TFC57767.1 methionine ABC transporter substrate-binding protein [Cryobacterium sp. TMB1-7]TFC74492.1 methionine ABC transporter substrate-